MPDLLASLPYITLSAATFDKVRQLLQQLADQLGTSAILITEADYSAAAWMRPGDLISVFVCPDVSLLLWGQPASPKTALPPEFSTLYPDRFYHVRLSFETTELRQILSSIGALSTKLTTALHVLDQQLSQPSPPTSQRALIEGLLSLYASESNSCLLPDTVYPTVSIFQPFQEALHQQIEQERVLNHVGRQIQQSLELPVILTTAVQETQQFLQVEQLAVYQFDLSPRQGGVARQVAGTPGPSLAIHYPDITVAGSDRAAVPNPLLAEVGDGERSPLVWNFDHPALCPDELDRCQLAGTVSCATPYCQGQTITLAPATNRDKFPPCLLQFLPTPMALLAVPILLHEELWGVLVAYETQTERRWQPNETTFLEQVAQSLAIAIQQSQLYTQLREQTERLEQLVAARTQELHTALLAAQAASRAKSEFLAAMSHELRTPLTCVIGMSATLLRCATGQSGNYQLPEQKQQEYLRTIYDSGEQLLALINDILDLSQVEAGKTILELTELVPSKAASQALQVMRDQAKKGKVDLRLDLNIDPKRDRLIADQQRLHQILLNLLSNAIKFTPEAGEVILRVWSEENAVIFQVEDTGIGIPEDQVPLLFQRFQQLDSSYRRKYGGTGLGLALTKQLVELHHGRIEVDSILNQGSSFTVWFPMHLNPNPMSPRDNHGVSTELPQGRIALIEDQDDIAMLICDILTTAGYQVVWMVEGFAAAQRIQILRPQVVITNTHADKTDDYEIIECLRRVPTTRDLKILALTTDPIPDSLLKKYPKVIDDYLVKPFQPQQLLDKVTALSRI